MLQLTPLPTFTAITLWPHVPGPSAVQAHESCESGLGTAAWWHYQYNLHQSLIQAQQAVQVCAAMLSNVFVQGTGLCGPCPYKAEVVWWVNPDDAMLA